MMMTDDELRGSMRKAADKRAQVGILAELNAVSEDQMRAQLPLRETLLRMASLSDMFEASIDSVVTTRSGDVEAALERIRERDGKEDGDDHTGAG